MMSTSIIENKPTIPEKLTQPMAYPDFRFYCPFCGSLDVSLTTNESAIVLSVCCLDCERKWRRVK